MFSFYDVKDLTCFFFFFFTQKQSLVFTSIGVGLKYFMKLVMVFDIFFACGKFKAR